MAGGLLNIISLGNNNVFLTGNPSKTFFKVTYSKYSNFGLQKFRLDYDGSRDLRLTEPSTYTFTVKRYAELLMDTYLVVTLPDIWSPVYPPTPETNHQWVPYGFRWIKDLGTQIISEISITCGSLTLQKYTGDYISAMVERDFSEEKKKLFNEMSGNVPELNDPANAYSRNNTYPSASYTVSQLGAEPSIRGRTLYIPINTWFTLNSGCAFPLIALQYNELVISVTLRPIQELFQIRDVFDFNYNFPYIQPDFNQSQFQMYRFLQSPPTPLIKSTDYVNTVSTWNADVHLISTYCFLSKEEAKVFASQDQVYLVKDVFNYFFENVTGTNRIKVNSNGMISNWMFYLQRNDVNLRNEWSNYTNWPYRNLPSNIIIAPNTPLPGTEEIYTYGMGVNPNSGEFFNSGITITGDYHSENQKEIMETMGILLDGEYRENTQVSGIFNYIEKYTRTRGFAKDGLYCYNFCLDTDPFQYQPSGAINLSKFRNIQLEITTYVPPVDSTNSAVNIICDGNGNPVGIQKSNWRLYEYNYNLVLYEERYNILSFIGGNCGMMYSR
jgi:hypothetical protein